MTYISKSQLRKTLLSYRKLIDNELFYVRNKQLFDKVEKLVDAEGAKTIHTFLPIDGNKEPDITISLPKLRNMGCRIIVSRTNFNRKVMHHFYLEENTILEKNKLGIPEPMNASPASFEEVEIVLVPLVAGDKIGNRLGYGGGYYDQLLKDVKCKKVGLSLAPLVDQISQAEAWDIQLDEILTPFDEID